MKLAIAADIHDNRHSPEDDAVAPSFPRHTEDDLGAVLQGGAVYGRVKDKGDDLG
jgi:hypothetical protein